MDFTLTDEQKALREMAHDFAKRKIRPVAWEYDRDGTWPDEILRKAWELGLMKATAGGVRRARAQLPRGRHRRGGAQLGLLGHREFDRCQWPRARAARGGRLRGVKKQYFGMLTEEYKLASFCLTEPAPAPT